MITVIDKYGVRRRVKRSGDGFVGEIFVDGGRMRFWLPADAVRVVDGD